MKSETPKVLIPLAGKPILQHLMDAITSSGVDPKPLIVVGENQPLIESTLGRDNYTYVRQDKPLGTGHAVRCAESYLAPDTENVIVLYGDHPFVSTATIRNLHRLHEQENVVITMMTTALEDFIGWRAPFADFGRILRNDRGKICGIVEMKDATLEQLMIPEVNPAFFCFKAGWLWQNLKLLTNDNAKHEYYLTDLVRLAISQNKRIASLSIDPLQSIGINTPEHLEIARRMVSSPHLLDS